MKLALALVPLLILSGCATPEEPTIPPVEAECRDLPPVQRTLYLADQALADAPGPDGMAHTNQGTEAFAEELTPWYSEPLVSDLRMEGNVTLDVLFHAAGPNLYGAGTDLYIQFGSNRSFAAEWLFPAESPAPGDPYRLRANATLPKGGFTLEAGDRFALLITSLRQGTSGGHMIHVGGEDPSRLELVAHCAPQRNWAPHQNLQFPVVLPGNQGLFSGAVPPTEGVNRFTTPFEVSAEASRITIALRQQGGAGVKNDMDLYMLDAAGAVVARATSPSANEVIVLWPENLAFVPPGAYQLRVESYSGVNYTGRLAVQVERESHTH